MADKFETIGRIEAVGWRRVPSSVPTCKAYQRDLEDGHLTVFVGREPTEQGVLWHLSISHRRNVLAVDGHCPPGRIPTWDEIK